MGSLNLQGEGRPLGLGLSETLGGSTCDTHLSLATLAAFGSVILKSYPEGLPIGRERPHKRLPARSWAKGPQETEG